MVGLCKAYAAQVSESPGKALESPAFTALVTEAGGADKVDGFCEKTAAAAEHPGGAPSDVQAPSAGDRGQQPSPASNAQIPTSRPQPPAVPPTAAPTGLPTPSR